MIPDFVVADTDEEGGIVETSEVILIAEIVSPGNAAADRVMKLHYYAAAGIDWYLLVDQERLVLRLMQRDGMHYVEHTTVNEGEVLDVREPFAFRIDTRRRPK